MKALELTVYHAIPCGGPCQCESYLLPDGDQISVASVNVESKRLTDARTRGGILARQVDRADG